MRKKMELADLWYAIIRNAKDLLYIKRELTDKEKLENLKKNNKENQRLLDIKAIRESGGYTPDYDKLKKYTDYKLSYETTENELYVDRFFKPIITEKTITKIVSPEIKTVCERPENFIGADGSIINAVPRWMEAVRTSYEKDARDRKLRELQREQHKEVKQEHYQYVMQKMMEVE